MSITETYESRIDPATLRALAEFPASLEAQFAAFPAEAVHWSPADWSGIPSERFTAHEQVCHVRDVEIDGYRVRFRRALREADPFLPDLGSEALARERHYAGQNARAALAAFRIARAETLATLADLDATQWSRPAFFEDYGPTTVRGLVHYLCSHDQQHMAGLQWLRGKFDAARHPHGRHAASA